MSESGEAYDSETENGMPEFIPKALQKNVVNLVSKDRWITVTEHGIVHHASKIEQKAFELYYSTKIAQAKADMLLRKGGKHK